MLGRRSNTGGYLHHCITIHRVSIWTAVVFGKARRFGAHQQLRVVWVSDRSPMRYDEEVSQRGDKRLLYQFTDGIALEICSFDMLGRWICVGSHGMAELANKNASETGLSGDTSPRQQIPQRNAYKYRVSTSTPPRKNNINLSPHFL